MFSVQTLATGILIVLGAGIIALSVWGTKQVLRLLRGSPYRRVWRSLCFLMLFFFVGYLAALALVLTRATEWLVIVTGVVFFFGALFVYLVVRVGYLTIRDLQREITERRQAEAARHDAEEQTRLLVETALDAVITMDATGVITTWNAQAETLFGWSRQEAVGQPLAATIIPPRYREAHTRGLHHFLATGEGLVLHKHIELTALHRDGHEFPVELTITPLQVRGTSTFSGFVRDITTRQQAEAASRAKTTFLATMSHELRTPLNPIIGYSELLYQKAADLGHEAFLSGLQTIQRAGKQLLDLITDLLDISQLEAGTVALFLETFDICRLVQGVVTTIAPLLAKNANTLTVHCADTLGTMRADQTKLRQSLLHLLSNACKFTTHGTITLEVTREPADSGAWLTFRVTDTGIGMTPAQMETVFQAFTQADAATTRKYGGAGLGLAISQRFCQLMGGDITVESALGQGSTFTMRVPAEVSVPADRGD